MDMEMPRRRETEPKKLISFIKELRTLLPEQKAKLPPTPTATAMPIPIFSSGRRLLQSLWMAVRSTFAKGITRLILLPPRFQDADSTTSFRSQATIEMQMSWQGGALRIPRPMLGLASRRPLGIDSLIDWSTRQQYKLNGLRQFTLGRHDLTFFGIGYYGFSYVPGLIPITVPAPGDRIDNRQLDRAHTFILVATDNWRLGEQRQLSFSGFFRKPSSRTPLLGPSPLRTVHASFLAHSSSPANASLRETRLRYG
jgi:hypothetical protein